MVVAARCVDAVVAGDDVDLTARDVHGCTFEALVAFGDVERAAGDGRVAVGVDAVVARFDLKRAAFDQSVAVGVQRIVRAVEGKIAAFDRQENARLESLGAGVVRKGRATAAACGDGEVRTGNGQLRLGLHAVLPRVQGQDGIRNVNEAERFVGIVRRTQRVAAGGDVEHRVPDRAGVLAGHAVVFRCDRQSHVFDQERVLARDAVMIVGVDLQRAAAGKDKVCLGIQAGVRFFVGLGGERISKGVALAVGKRAVRAVGKIDRNARRLINIERAAIGAGHGHVLQHKRDVLLGCALTRMRPSVSVPVTV